MLTLINFFQSKKDFLRYNCFSILKQSIPKNRDLIITKSSGEESLSPQNLDPALQSDINVEIEQALPIDPEVVTFPWKEYENTVLDLPSKLENQESINKVSKLTTLLGDSLSVLGSVSFLSLLKTERDYKKFQQEVKRLDFYLNSVNSTLQKNNKPKLPVKEAIFSELFSIVRPENLPLLSNDIDKLYKKFEKQINIEKQKLQAFQPNFKVSFTGDISASATASGTAAASAATVNTGDNATVYIEPVGSGGQKNDQENTHPSIEEKEFETENNADSSVENVQPVEVSALPVRRGFDSRIERPEILQLFRLI